ncbi:MAG: hypothetical protein R2720_04965 [Candidatus Nanopelagicales bacterium]
MKRVAGLVVVGGTLIGTSPAVAEPVPVDQAVAEINQMCVASRTAFLEGGTVRLRLKPDAAPVQVQRYNPVTGRLSDSGWPSVTARSIGTYDRGGFVLDARLRRAQVAEAARYLGFHARPWVLTRGQFGVIPSRTFQQSLRIDLLSPDRFIDLDSTTVPAQPQRCATHMLAAGAKTTVDKTVDGGRTTWNVSYRMDEGAGPIQVNTTLVAQAGVFTSGTAQMRSGRRLGVDVDNYARWDFSRPRVRLPDKSRVVSQRRWIRATDAAALVTDIKYLSGSLEGRTTLTGLRKAARRSVKQANRGHQIAIRIRRVPSGVVLWARNPFTGQMVAFEVVINPVPTAVSRRIR